MSYHESGMSKVSSMREVRAILYEYHEEDIQIPYLLAECVEYLIAERDRLREALEYAERRSKQIGETSNGYYERLADEFRDTYGHLPPGKDDPLRTIDRDILQQEWEEFLAEPANVRRAALQEAGDD